MFRRGKGQSVLEYSLLVAAIIAGLLLTQTYVKNAFQGKVKESADEMGKQFDAANAGDYVTSWQNAGAGTTTTLETTTGGAAPTSQTNVTASETVTSSEEESWGTQPANPDFQW